MAEFLEMMGGNRGLGFFSEQAMEGFHQELKSEWKGATKVDRSNEHYGENLRQTTVRINGKHLE